MAGLRNTVATVGASVSELGYRLRNLVSGKRPVHLVVCGPDDKLAEALTQHLSKLFNPADVTLVWGRALWAKKVRSRVIISWDPDDAAYSHEIEHSLSATRTVVWIATVANPWDLVSERSEVLPHHFSQGADYRLSVDGETKSITQPGVVSRFLDVSRIVNEQGSPAVVVKREDFRKDSRQVFATIADVVEQHGGPAPIPEVHIDSIAADELLFADDNTPQRLERVASQRARFPDLDAVGVELGYRTPPTISPSAKVSARGLIVAFHTPDDIYKAEADRLRQSLDALDLEYMISVVEPESNWVRTTLLKPTWIAPVRKKLRGPLLYVDVDAFVHTDPWPYVADMDADMAAVVYKNGQLNSATLWINDTPGAELILSQWAAGAGDRRGADRGDLEHTGDNGDQGVLKLIVEAEEQKPHPTFRFGRLPPNLATIFDRTDEYRFGPIAIEQLQVSREVTNRSKRLSRRHERLRELSD